MSVIARKPTSNAAVSGATEWTNPTYVYTDDTNYATASPSKNATPGPTQDWGGFDFSIIPDGATINSISVNINYCLSVDATLYTIRYTLYDNTTACGANYKDTSHNLTNPADWSSTPNATPTAAQLKSANFKIRVEGDRGNQNTASTYSIDFIEITVDYTGYTDVDKSYTPLLEALVAVSLAVAAPLEARELPTVSNSITASIESLTAPSSAQQKALESLFYIEQSISPKLESIVESSNSEQVTVESLNADTMAWGRDIESLISISNSIEAKVESLFALSFDEEAKLEANFGLSQSTLAHLESLSVGEISNSVPATLESLLAPSVSLDSDFESLTPITSGVEAKLESNVGVDNTEKADLESFFGVSNDEEANLESLTALTKSVVAHFESRIVGGVERDVVARLESLALLSVNELVRLESLTPIDSSEQPLIESLALISSSEEAKLESWLGVSASLSAQIESIGAVSASIAAQLESLASSTPVSKDIAALLEALLGDGMLWSVVFESGSTTNSVAVSKTVPTEFLVGVEQAIEVKFEMYAPTYPVNNYQTAIVEALAGDGMVWEVALEARNPGASYVQRDANVGFEGLQSGETDYVVGIESVTSGNTIASTLVVRFEATSYPIKAREAKFESLAPALLVEKSPSIEALAGLLPSRVGFIESLVAVSRPKTAFIESSDVGVIYSTKEVPCESLARAVRDLLVKFESFGEQSLSFVGTIPAQTLLASIYVPSERSFVTIEAEIIDLTPIVSNASPSIVVQDLSENVRVKWPIS